ncbi:trehalose 6-phosphate phosphatase [Clavulina sp. PMI_390]|nr:trehalose 6-phosphate phosphatase [Clavulina sp. PMI_390]
MSAAADPAREHFAGGHHFTVDTLTEQIRKLEEDYAAKDVPLSGRIVHVAHYLPIISTLNSPEFATGVPTPPRTPDRPLPASLGAAVNTPAPRWSLQPRRGHTAMHSGIRSLSSTHEQVIVGWTGPIHGGSSLPATISDGDKAALDELVLNYKDEASTDASLKPMTYGSVWMDDKTSHDHYEGYCKTTLWPLFHYLLWQDVTTELPVEDKDWNAYVRANEAYAKRVAELYRPGDLVWIHDYHCLLVPRFLRQLVPDAYIGLFVHTPFPSSEVFRCLPRRKELLDGMLGASLVVFQTYSYARHFASSCIRVCGYESAPTGIDVKGVLTTVKHCAVGIDAVRVEHDTLRPGIAPKMEALRGLYQGKKIIVARDKLDVVKGILQKLRAFEKLLRDYPQWRGKVVMIQVTSPALSDSPKLERQVSELVAHINGEYGSLDFIPVHHYHQVIKKDEFYALLSVADLALITPLRDGMNTTSMEYVICQEKTSKSPLILSEFMGISPNMTHALQVNPWDLGNVAAQIHHGLTMPTDERLSRHAALYEIVRTHTSHHWSAILVKMLLGLVGTQNMARHTPELERPFLKERYDAARKRLLLFDYDGTLTPIVKTPSMATPSPDALAALEHLCADPKNVVYIISGRDSPFLDQHLGYIRKLGFSAEHGGFLRAPRESETGGDEWTSLTESLDMSWMSEVKEIFEYYTERTTGCFIEMKKSSITWHYRGADPEWGAFQCRQCLDLLENNVAPKRPIEVLVGKMNLEVRPVAVNKGEIVKRLMYANPDAEFIFCAGDDKTDEDMFRALGGVAASASASPSGTPPESADLAPPVLGPVDLAIEPASIFSVSVGASTKKTLAMWHVTTPFEVIKSMLKLVGVEPKDANPTGGEPEHHL